MTGLRVLAAMSGGVDSSVAALLLKRAGYEVVGVTMSLFGQAQQKAYEQAATVAAKLGIEHRVIDFSDQFHSDVIDYFCQTYQSGETPNPCIVCNQLIKFGALLGYADSIGAPFLATGHYSRIDKSSSDYGLYKAVDSSKDQSYFLYRLNQAQLARILLPLGAMTKAQARQLAKEAGLPAFSDESQDICFLDGADYRSFLESQLELIPGDMVDETGKVIGRHKGLAQYTIGQRQGLGVTSNTSLYIIEIDSGQSRIVIGNEDALFKRMVKIKQLNWIAGNWPTDISGLYGRIRYRMPDAPILSLERNGDAGATITFVDPVRAVTPGQSAVIYKCDEVLGGGIIIG